MARATEEEADAIRAAAGQGGIIRTADRDLIPQLVRRGWVDCARGGTPRVTDQGYTAARRRP